MALSLSQQPPKCANTANMLQDRQPGSPGKDGTTESAERIARIRIKNRRKMYLDRHPSYFTSPDLELSGAYLLLNLQRQTNGRQTLYYMTDVFGDFRRQQNVKQTAAPKATLAFWKLTFIAQKPSWRLCITKIWVKNQPSRRLKILFLLLIMPEVQMAKSCKRILKKFRAAKRRALSGGNSE